MGLYIYFGRPGTGKTMSLTSIVQNIYKNESRKIWKACINTIENLNYGRTYKLTFPDRVPIFSNYKIRFKCGYKRYFQTYFINPYYMGIYPPYIGMPEQPVEFIPPYSQVVISEAQRIYNSRESSTFANWVSAWFEWRRHAKINVWLDCQRVNLIDKNLKDLTDEFVEIIGTEFGEGDISFYVRKFSNWQAVAKYLESGEYVSEIGVENNVGVRVIKAPIGVASAYNSHDQLCKFIPPDREGFDFTYLEHEKNIEEVNPKLKLFYVQGEPATFRVARKGVKTNAGNAKK